MQRTLEISGTGKDFVCGLQQAPINRISAQIPRVLSKIMPSSTEKRLLGCHWGGLSEPQYEPWDNKRLSGAADKILVISIKSQSWVGAVAFCLMVETGSLKNGPRRSGGGHVIIPFFSHQTGKVQGRLDGVCYPTTSLSTRFNCYLGFREYFLNISKRNNLVDFQRGSC